MSFGPLDELAQRPDASVLVIHARHDIADDWIAGHVEAARRAYSKMIVVPLRGYSGDAEALRGRDVVFWPWLGAPSAQAQLRPFAGIVARHASRVRIIAPKSEFIGPANLNGHDPIGWARENAEVVPPTPAADLESEWFGGDAPAEQPEPVPELLEETHERVSDYVPDMIEGDPWPEPVDVFAKIPLPPLKRDYLPPAIAGFVFDQSEIIGADPCILAISALVCAAACTHDSIQLQPKLHERGWRESARLWGAFIGDPSVRKTPAANRATSHLKKLNIDLAEQSQREAEEYAKRMKAHAAREAEFYKTTAVGRPASHPGEAPERPKKRRLMTQDATIEAVGIIMQDNPGGILVYQDELSGFFGGMDAYRAKGGKDAPFWLQAYNGGSMAVDRVGRESMIIPNVSACVLGGIQPSAMRAASAGLPDDGLLQRFMVVTATEVDELGDDRRADQEAIDTWRRIIDFLVAQRAHPDEEPIRFTAGAYQIARAVESKIKTLAANPMHAERFRYHVGKWPGLFCRLCLTYHAIECANLGVPIGGTIDEATAAQVAVFLLEYLKPHTLGFYADLAGGDSKDVAVRWLAGWILSRELVEFVPSDAARVYKNLRGMDENERRAVFEKLRLLGWIDYAEGSNRFAAKRLKVNPQVHQLFAERAEFERENRRGAVDAIADRNMNGS